MVEPEAMELDPDLSAALEFVGGENLNTDSGRRRRSLKSIKKARELVDRVIARRVRRMNLDAAE